jgi:hypothetical protein
MDNNNEQEMERVPEGVNENQVPKPPPLRSELLETIPSVVRNNVEWQPGMTLESVEKEVILAAFRHFRGNKTMTARSLNIAIRTLDNKLDLYKEATKAMEEQSAREYNEREEFLKAQRGEPNNWKPKPVRTFKPAMEEKTARAKAREQNGALSEEGLPVESTSRDSAQRPVPVSQREEVQGVSSKHAA